MGRAAVLSLACADTETCWGKADEPKECQGGSVKIGHYEWQENAVPRCFAGSDDAQEPEDESDTGAVDEDLPIRTCVHCSFSTQSRNLLQCVDCHQFACIRCCHRCGPQSGEDRLTGIGLFLPKTGTVCHIGCCLRLSKINNDNETDPLADRHLTSWHDFQVELSVHLLSRHDSR